MKNRLLVLAMAAMCLTSAVSANVMDENTATEGEPNAAITEFGTGGSLADSESSDIMLKNMTLNDVVELAKKGDELTWSDFEAYNGIKSGTPFGMLAYLYVIDEGYYLSVSGAVDGAPDKVQLCHYNQNISVDVLTGDVEAFIAKYSDYELPDIGYSFDEIYNMTEAEVRAVFNEKGLTDTEKYHVYPQRNGNTAVNNNSMTVLLYPENYMINLTGHELVSHVTDMNDKDKLFKNSDIVWDSEKVRKSLGLPKEYFDVYDVSSMTVTKSAPEGENPDIRRYCECSIRCKSNDKDKIADLRRAALNYVQLNPDFALVYPETYGGENSDNEKEISYKIVKLPDKTVYKLGESISLKGIQVEMKKGNEEPVIYTYPDVAFDYQSDIPKPAAVVISGDYKRDKVGTVAIKAVGSDDVLFTVEFVDDSAVKENSVMLTAETGCFIHLDLMTGTFSMSGSLYQNFAVIGTFERKGSDLYLYPENASTEFYVLNREDDHFISRSDEKGIGLKQGLVFSAENDAFWEKLTPTNESSVKGDANCDGSVDMADVVLIMQALANPDKYGENGSDSSHISGLGRLNADMDGDGLTVGDAQAIQKKLLGLDEKDIQRIDSSLIARKTFVYEKEGFGGDFTIDFDEDGTFVYSTGYLSSYAGGGKWEISGNTVTMTEGTEGEGKTIVNRFKIVGNEMVFIAEGSDNFYSVRVKDGEKFYAVNKLTESTLTANAGFLYEKYPCTLYFVNGGRYFCIEGDFSAYQDEGTWTISGNNTVVLTGKYGTNRFRFNDNALIYIAEGSDGFSFEPEDGDKFYMVLE